MQHLPACLVPIALGAAALLLGEFDFARAEETIRLRREEDKEKFVALLASFLEQQGELSEEESEGGNVPRQFARKVCFSFCRSSKWRKTQRAKEQYVLDNEGLEIPEELAALIKEIKMILGLCPKHMYRPQQGRPEQASIGRKLRVPKNLSALMPMDVHVYDEWDYRRAGYRAAWCSLTGEIPASGSIWFCCQNA